MRGIDLPPLKSINPRSIRARLLGATFLLLLLFFSVLALVLVTAFRQSSEQALNEKLLSEIYGLLAAAEVSAEGQIEFPEQFPQFRFLQADSGLAGEVFGDDAVSLWRSDSMGVVRFLAPAPKVAGEALFDSPTLNGDTWYRATLSVSWELEGGQLIPLRFSVAESGLGLGAEVREFRNTVLRWLSAAALLLLVTEGLVMRWGLLPLARAAREIDEVKIGRRDNLGPGYPQELKSVTGNLNSLLDQQRQHLGRYRHVLADAAHSIKTPLAALKNGLAGDGENLQQVDAIDRIIEYHLKKAATAGPAVLQAPVPVAPLVDQLVSSLKKVYADKNLQFVTNTQPESQFPGDTGDFFELLGNLLDNACKAAHKQVSCSIAPRRIAGGDFLEIEVTDDGPGIDGDLKELILQRGMQVDPGKVGQGVGLAVVGDILAFYRGGLEIGESPAGGAVFTARIPVNEGAAGEASSR